MKKHEVSLTLAMSPMFHVALQDCAPTKAERFANLTLQSDDTAEANGMSLQVFIPLSPAL